MAGVFIYLVGVHVLMWPLFGNLQKLKPMPRGIVPTGIPVCELRHTHTHTHFQDLVANCVRFCWGE